MFRTKLLPAAVVVASACASCTNEVPEIPSSELYTREWVKEFGAVDSRQDWNNATRAGVRVTTDAPTRVRITATIGKNNYLLADYADVAGTRNLEFDMPRGVKEITVAAGPAAISTHPGGTADFSASGRAIWDDKEQDAVVNISRKPFREISDKAVLSFAEYLPEEKDNRGKVTQNFSYVSTGPFTVYPVFWNTRVYNTLGVYYIDKEGTDEEEMVYVPFYTNKISHRDAEGNLLPNGNLEYLYVSKYQECWQQGKKEFYENQASEFVEGRTSFKDFTDDDWRLFEKAVIEIYGNPFSGNTLWDYGLYTWMMTESEQEQSRIDDFRYEKAEEIADYGVAVTVTEVHITGVADEWKYPGTSQCSHPNRDEYFRYYDQGKRYDEIAQLMKLPPKWHTEGVCVDIKPGTRFGMFIRTEDNPPTESTVQVRRVPMVYDASRGYKMPQEDDYLRFYSQARYNPDVMTDKETGASVNSVHAATYDYPAPSGITYQVLAFEDWKSADVYDLNDMVFFIDAGSTFDNPKVTDEDKPEPEPVKWLVACEDLGAKDDFDFNDVVFEVEHVAGQRTARITPLAAGGTLETYLMRDGVEISPEWHSLFGGAWHTQMINTTGITVRAESFEIEVPEDFTLSSSDDGDYRTNMGGFHLKVVRDDSSEDTITPPGPGEAPQMLLIYQSADGKWQWPRERHNIKLAYRDFEPWMNSGNYDIDTSEGGSNWFDNAHPDHVVKR